MEERKGEAAINGTRLTVLGTKLGLGKVAPEVVLQEGPLLPFNLLSDTVGKIRLISVVPCIDTGLCEMQTIEVSKRARLLSDQVVAITVSSDLPETQMRWCGRTGVDNVTMLSDHMDMQFGAGYGTWLKELRKEQRSIFVIDTDNVVRHVQYIPEVGHPIDYDAAFAVVTNLLEAHDDAESSDKPADSV